MRQLCIQTLPDNSYQTIMKIITKLFIRSFNGYDRAIILNTCERPPEQISKYQTEIIYECWWLMLQAYQCYELLQRYSVSDCNEIRWKFKLKLNFEISFCNVNSQRYVYYLIHCFVYLIYYSWVVWIRIAVIWFANHCLVAFWIWTCNLFRLSFVGTFDFIAIDWKWIEIVCEIRLNLPVTFENQYPFLFKIFCNIHTPFECFKRS